MSHQGQDYLMILISLRVAEKLVTNPGSSHRAFCAMLQDTVSQSMQKDESKTKRSLNFEVIMLKSHFQRSISLLVFAKGKDCEVFGKTVHLMRFKPTTSRSEDFDATP